ncbi:hypothetical protein [Pseudofrankia saprophytica]|uniref:hypothetical protein n=1 Tax=Pseudofrankia saprophytica TaxID=298655 RepID=UPI000234D801|nr:hypothetical protein [Pseudofrankia saprophytica]
MTEPVKATRTRKPRTAAKPAEAQAAEEVVTVEEVAPAEPIADTEAQADDVTTTETDDVTPAGVKNTAEPAAEEKPKRANTSHTTCDHPSTKAARAKCRRDRAKAAEPTPAEAATA